MDNREQPKLTLRERFEIANRHWSAGRLKEAAAAYKDILVTNPESPAAICRLGEIALKSGDNEGGRSYFLQTLAANPRMPWAHVGLGRLAEQSGDLDAALSYFREALIFSPELTWLIKKVDDLVQEKRDRLAQPNFKDMFEHANGLLEKHCVEEAEPIYRALLAESTRKAPLLCKLGEAAALIGNSESALAHFRAAREADPSLVWSYIGEAEIRHSLDDSAGAETALSGAEALPELPPSARGRIQTLFREIASDKARSQSVQIVHWPERALRVVDTKGSTAPKVNIVAWDLSHNPVGRAICLAEVAKSNYTCEIVGPIFPKYGTNLWAPLRESPLPVPISGFFADTLSTFMEGATRLVAAKPCDVAWVSKPRMPSLLIGLLYKLIHGSAIVLDIDDDELAFVKADEPMSLDAFISSAGNLVWDEPFGREWTQLAASMISEADAITTCNPVIQKVYGGTVVRHARDPLPFAVAASRRDHVRVELQLAETDKVILFLGTPRRHKGLLEVAEAVRRLADPAVVFLVAGTITDDKLKKDLLSIGLTRLILLPDQPFSRIAELNAAADLVCILLDPDNQISNYQTPAKISDALASGTSILVTPTPGVADLIEPGRMTATSPENLVDTLRAALAQKDGDAALRREFFRAELSTPANAPRARAAIEKARNGIKPVPESFLRLLRHIDDNMPGGISRECAELSKGIFRSTPRLRKLKSASTGMNMVFFWKQNDSGIYGRRQDMLLKQFAGMSNIDKILHIDAPISADQLNIFQTGEQHRQSNAARMVVGNTVSRFLRTQEDGHVHRRTFIYRGKETQFLGQDLPPAEAFPNAVENWLNELGMTDNVMAWVCPVVPHFPDVQARLGFSFVACDVIDDQRKWPLQPSMRKRIERNYRDTFAAADVAFANCEPVARWLKEEGLAPILVPNGMEDYRGVDNWDLPRDLATLPRPIVGYSGTLRNRIDWQLIDRLASIRPNWSFVLIGERPADIQVRHLSEHRNIHMLGAIPHNLALNYIANFDAAMIPHMDSSLSSAMNPLKLYVYRSVGIPVVSAPIANIDELAGDIRIAGSPEQFITELERAIAMRNAKGRVFPPDEIMRNCSWESRSARIMTHIQEAFERSRKSGEKTAAA